MRGTKIPVKTNYARCYPRPPLTVDGASDARVVELFERATAVLERTGHLKQYGTS